MRYFNLSRNKPDNHNRVPRDLNYLENEIVF